MAWAERSLSICKGCTPTAEGETLEGKRWKVQSGNTDTARNHLVTEIRKPTEGVRRAHPARMWPFVLPWRGLIQAPVPCRTPDRRLSPDDARLVRS
jgi:hypothetical protein